MKLVENIPLNTKVIEDLISNPEDLFLVWPKATYPFDHEQWKKVLNPEAGHVPFLVYIENQLIGHAALGKTEHEDTYSLNFLYIVPELRSKGLGVEMINELGQYAKNKLHAKKLSLVVRSYNPRAQKCYEKCGFVEECRKDTIIKMVKNI